MVAYGSKQNSKGQQVLCQSASVLLTVHGEACAQWMSSAVWGVLQLAEVLLMQHMVLVALPGWQAGVWV